MKLSEFSDTLFKIISNEEQDLELPVMKATVSMVLTRGKEQVLHSWEYEAKKEDRIAK